jgi:hypothetical protein
MKTPDAAPAVPDEPAVPPPDPGAQETPSPAPRRGLRWLLGLAGPLIVLGALIYVLSTHGSDIGHAIDRASPGTLALIAALALLTLMARSEVALSCMSAMRRQPSRADVHASSSLAFLLATINHYIASIVRATVLKRVDPLNAPTIPQMFVIDGSTTLIEGLMAALLLIISAGALKLAWWLPILAVLGAIVALVVAIYVRRRFRHHAIFDGLEMLSHSRARRKVGALTVVIFACQIGRTLVGLDAVGLHATLLQSVAVFIAGGVLSNLLAGPAGGTLAAPLVIFGHRGLGQATAAGLILSGSALLASVVYALWGGGVLLWRLHRNRRRAIGIEITRSTDHPAASEPAEPAPRSR